MSRAIWHLSLRTYERRRAEFVGPQVRAWCHTRMRGSDMAFGQQSGPPASHKQLQYLDALVRKAGHDGFRDARGPLGLTQRQAGGKFTKDEASSLIDQLLAADPDVPEVIGRAQPTMEQTSASDRLEGERVQALKGMPASLLADELERRGWTATPPAR